MSKGTLKSTELRCLRISDMLRICYGALKVYGIRMFYGLQMFVGTHKSKGTQMFYGPQMSYGTQMICRSQLWNENLMICGNLNFE